MSREIIIYTDGGSRGNPGPAAAGFVLSSPDGTILQARGVFLGEATNNIAEYTALVKSLESALELDAQKVIVYTDSELMTRQIIGRYKVKSPNIRPLYQQAVELFSRFDDWKIKHVRREKNKQADGLVNMTLDARADVDETPATYTTAEDKGPGSKKLRLGVLISGGGRTLLNILDYITAGKLNAEVPIVISSRSMVAGVRRAENAGLNTKIIRRKDFADIDSFSSALEQQLTEARVDLVVQAGWLCLWKIPARFRNRVMNIHPALLPSFGGKGMWGHHVHEAVLAAGCKVSGCTVHFCTNEYDAGPIIVQLTCPVAEDDTPDTLAARVFEQECVAYPQAISLFSQDKLIVENNRVKILP